jgi:hypothetical protein
MRIDGSRDLVREVAMVVVKSFIEFHLSPCSSSADQLDLLLKLKREMRLDRNEMVKTSSQQNVLI